MRLLVIGITLLLCACAEPTIERVEPTSITLGCGDYQSVIIEQGVLNNNVWNKQAAQGAEFTQCLESRELNGKKQYGWSWNWPNIQRAVFGQPQIKMGQSPWQSESKYGDDLPLPLSDLKSLNVSTDLEVTTDGEHNVALTLWLERVLHG